MALADEKTCTPKKEAPKIGGTYLNAMRIFLKRFFSFRGGSLQLFKIFGIIALGTLGAIAVFLFYAGFFDPIAMSVERVGPFQFIYREHRGSYQGIQFVMNDVYRYLHDSLHITTDTGCTVFYDVPGKTDEKDLRSLSGIITGSDKKVRSPYKKGMINQTEAIVGRCYLRSFFSYSTGSFKFHTTVSEFAEKSGVKQNGPMIEVYDMVHRSIIYIATCNVDTLPVPEFSGD